MSDCQCVTIQQSNVSLVSTFQVDAHRLWTSSLKYRGLHDNKSHKLWNLSLDHKKKNLKAEGTSERLMGWPGWYWSKVHFNCVCPQSPAGHTDYDALRRQFVKVLLIGLVLSVDILISEDWLMSRSDSLLPRHTWYKIHTHPINLQLTVLLHQSHQKRDPRCNQ